MNYKIKEVSKIKKQSFFYLFFRLMLCLIMIFSLASPSFVTATTAPPVQDGYLQILSFFDTNGNGIWDSFEAPLPFWGFRITGTNGSYLSAITGSNGWVSIPVSALETYTIYSIDQEGWLQTTTSSQTVFVASGEIKTVTFGIKKRGSGELHIYVFEDLNQNGQHDPSGPFPERLLPGFTFLITGPYGYSNLVTSGADGSLTLANLDAGIYQVEEKIQLRPGWVLTTKNLINNVTILSNYTGEVYFGNFLTEDSAQLRIKAFKDSNRDGIQNLFPSPLEEPLLGGWTFTLHNQTTDLDYLLTSSAAGWALATVPSGLYTISETLLSGWQLTTANNPTILTIKIGQIVDLFFGNIFATPFPSPKLLKAEPKTSSIFLSWMHSSETFYPYPVKGYALYRGSFSGAEAPTPLAVVTAATLTYLDTEVLLGNNYYYYVKAFDDQTPPNYSAASAEVTASPFTETINFTITASTNFGGALVPSGKVIINAGLNQTFTILPDVQYRIKEIKIDGILVPPASSSYTFFNVTSNHTLEVTFEKEMPSTTVIILQIGKTAFTVNGVLKALDSPPLIKNGRTLVPIRAIIEALGGTIAWSVAEQKITLNLGNINLQLWIGKNTATVNGTSIFIDSINKKVVPEIINARTMLPLRFISENLGASVNWDPSSQKITLIYSN